MERQEELFTEFKETENIKRPFTKGLFPNRTFVITVGYDKLILAALGSLVVLVVTFGFGFECGKKTTFEKHAPVARTVRTPAPAAPFVSVVAPNKQVAKKPPETIKQERPLLKPKPYTIQVATYRSKETAQQETIFLRQKGFSTSLVGVNGLYEVWAGEYSDVKEASQALSVLRKFYKDCLIKKK